MKTTAFRGAFFGLGLTLGILELVALFNGQAGDTASESVWALPWWGRTLVGVFCGWLTLHFGFEILPRPKKRT